MTVMKGPANPLDRLIKALSRLPGIGEKSAARLALFLLRDRQGLAAELAQSLIQIREKVRFCKECQNPTEEDLCAICRDPARRSNALCIVQEPVDLAAVEKTGGFHGLYHILHGALSPLDGVSPADLRFEALFHRVKNGRFEEVILATNPTPEGEVTALAIRKMLAPLSLKVTRIASGVPVGGTIEYSDPQTLSRSLNNRQEF